MRIATGEIEEGAGAPFDGKDPLRSLGRKGGEARAVGMTAKRRKEIAKKAAAKRWGNDGRHEGLAPQLRNPEVYFTRYLSASVRSCRPGYPAGLECVRNVLHRKADPLPHPVMH